MNICVEVLLVSGTIYDPCTKVMLKLLQNQTLDLKLKLIMQMKKVHLIHLTITESSILLFQKIFFLSNSYKF